MKTIFEKWPLQIKAGGTVSIDLPEPFRLEDSLFMLVHNSLNTHLNVTLHGANDKVMSQVFLLHSFPSILVFKEADFEHSETWSRVSFTSFDEFNGTITYRIKNPSPMMKAYR